MMTPSAGSLDTMTTTLYGDWFDADSRTVCTLLKLSGIHFQFTEIDRFKMQHKQNTYTSLNPLGTVPMLANGRHKVFGSIRVILNYLANSQTCASDSLFPAQCKEKLEQYMKWYESVLEPCAKSIIKNVLDTSKKSASFSSWMETEERDKRAKQ